MSWPGPWWLYVFVAGLIFGAALFLSIPAGDCEGVAPATDAGVQADA